MTTCCASGTVVGLIFLIKGPEPSLCPTLLFRTGTSRYSASLRFGVNSAEEVRMGLWNMWEQQQPS